MTPVDLLHAGLPQTFNCKVQIKQNAAPLNVAGLQPSPGKDVFVFILPSEKLNKKKPETKQTIKSPSYSF